MKRGLPRRPRAWWQWVLGLSLLGAAAVSAVLRYVPGLRPGAPYAVHAPEIRVPPELREAEAVPAVPGELSGCNLLLVTLDTTRADRVGCYGNADIETVTLDRLAREGVLLSQAITPAPATLPSHASILTGLYPFHHGVRANGVFRLSDETETLAEILAANAYSTAAVVSSLTLDSCFGLAQGFAFYDDDLSEGRRAGWQADLERPADQTTDRAVTWLRAHGAKPFFLWVHYFDPHAPYHPPSPYDKKYEPLLYDGEIAFVDAELGRLLGVVEELGLTDKTLVVVVGDHGEGLGQHDEWTHALLLYDTTLRVPLILRCGRRLGSGVHVGRQVCLVDVMPTVLSLLGVEATSRTDGLDLTQPVSDSRPVFADAQEGVVQWGLAPLLAVRRGSMKYVHGPDPELYDVRRDPAEKQNLFASRPHEVQVLKQMLVDFFGKDLERAAYGSLPDPKKMMRVMHRVHAAVAADTNEKRIRRLEEIARQHPDFFMVHRYRGECYARRGEFGKAEAAYRRCLELDPNVPGTHLELARVKAAQGEIDAAIQSYRQTLMLCPHHVSPLSELGSLLVLQRQFDEAADLLKRAFELRPTGESVVEEMVAAFAQSGRQDEAIGLLEERLEARPHLVAVRNSLAGLLAEKQQYARAVALLREGIEQMPERLEPVNNLALLLTTSSDGEYHRPLEAAVLMERVCAETNYEHAAYLHTLSVVYASLRRMDEAIAVCEKALRVAQDSSQAEMIQLISGNLESYKRGKEKGASPMPRTASGEDQGGGDETRNDP